MKISNKTIRPFIFSRPYTRTLTHVISLNFSTALSQRDSQHALPTKGHWDKGDHTPKITQPIGGRSRTEINVSVIPELLERISTLLFPKVSFQLVSIGSPPAGKDVEGQRKRLEQMHVTLQGSGMTVQQDSWSLDHRQRLREGAGDL